MACKCADCTEVGCRLNRLHSTAQDNVTSDDFAFEALWSRIVQPYINAGVTARDHNRAAVKDGARAMYHLLTQYTPNSLGNAQ